MTFGGGTRRVPTPGSLSVTSILAGLCILASILTLIPALAERLGNEAPDPLVRLLSAPFVHGFSPRSMVPHLIGNLLLLGYAGSGVEKSLGSLRFTVLTLAALMTYATIQALWDFDVNGASVFIWAYGPLLAVRDAPTGRWCPRSVPTPTLVVLFVMWIAVPLLMTSIPYSFGWTGSLPAAFLVANTFHLSATTVGIVGALIWRERLRMTRSP